MAYLRPNIEKMRGYVPGEQPKVQGLIKLNTNENPYPPSPRVIEAVRQSTTDALRLYPDPTCAALRHKIGERYGIDPSRILIGNGSDEILTLATRAFVGEGKPLAYFEPSYSLYPVLSDIQGARKLELPLDENFQPDAHASFLHRIRDVRLLFITQPNAPSGVWIPRVIIQRIAEEVKGAVLIDEAYVDFCSENCLDFASEYPNVLVTRTFSKSFSLAGMRVGWVVGARPLIEGLEKVKDSYNVNHLSQVAAIAALDDWDYFETTRRRVIATRERTRAALEQLGFFVYPSQTNFLLVRPPKISAYQYFLTLRDRKVLVRWWDKPRVCDFVRISIGTDEQMDAVLTATKEILAAP